ncbi:chemotaxis protein CheB [Sandarakinorhabdus sp. DWP1-3-1]|uniref:chemotaxis protein CheB n=1 Tax=Sandarakinorhabdus sp. DWP1-3-1 TaxID=2804627 RepID=UPI003CF224EF
MSPPGTIIVIGASAGGVDALRTIVAALPRELDAALFVTLHIGAHKSELPWLLGRIGTLTASHAVDGEEIRAGHVFVAPPDHHMVVEPGRIVLTRGPRENMARPAIDPMFRSAARAYGQDVIGIVLTGGLNDGTAGLIEVKAQGGTTIVQNPANAYGSSMPQSAIDNVVVDHVEEIAALGPLLIRLVAAHHDSGGRAHRNQTSGDAQERGMTGQFTQHKPVAVTCPDCGGALRQSQLGSLTQFTCHIGHVYTIEVMMAAQFLAMERFIEQALRSLGERGELCRVMIDEIRSVDEGAANQWKAAEAEVRDRTAVLQGLLNRRWIHPAINGGVRPAEG